MNYRIKLPFFLVSLLTASPAMASDLEAQKAALDVISSFATELCKDPSLTTKQYQYELSGKAKAELSNVLKKVADLGIEGAGNIRGHESEGLLQADLAELVKNSSNCRLEVWRDLKDRLVPAGLPSQKVAKHTVRIKPFPVQPGKISGVTLDVYIDGKYVDEIENIASQDTIEAGSFTEGLHTFRFENIDGYFVDAFGRYMQVPQMSGMECEGDFGVTASKTFQLVVWNDGMGNITCDLK
ncbi:MAG: hypothetical protein KJ595_16365 [Gammaproteobacteria bacterium]|nr:hypothetical protein [Gammaproteobacteria bacterium]RRU90189.1 hypothetical protein EGI97_21765 [Stutzerimonas xanthomarina]